MFTVNTWTSDNIELLKKMKREIRALAEEMCHRYILDETDFL